MIDKAVLQYIKQSVLCWLATIDEDGTPNVSPKEIFCAHDERTLLIANIASPGSRRNIVANRGVCVSFIDIFVQKGYKIKGMATVVKSSDPAFPALAQPLAELAGARFPFVSLFRIDVRSVEPIVAPSYRVFPDIGETDQIEAAMRTYGVQPAIGLK